MFECNEHKSVYTHFLSSMEALWYSTRLNKWILRLYRWMFSSQRSPTSCGFPAWAQLKSFWISICNTFNLPYKGLLAWNKYLFHLTQHWLFVGQYSRQHQSVMNLNVTQSFELKLRVSVSAALWVWCAKAEQKWIYRIPLCFWKGLLVTFPLGHLIKHLCNSHTGHLQQCHSAKD